MMDDDRDESTRPQLDNKQRRSMKRALKKSRNRVKCRMKSRRGLGRHRYK